MTRREKQRELFIELINYQLSEHNTTYDEVRKNPAWYMEYKTTPEKELEFMDYCVKRISEVLKVSKPRAEMEANWFILQWGLTSDQSENTKQAGKNQKRIKGE